MSALDTPPARSPVPEPVRKTLDELREELDLDLHLYARVNGERVHLYPDGGAGDAASGASGALVRTLATRDGPAMEMELRGETGEAAERTATMLHATLQRTFAFAQEIRFFTYELSERYEEINLLYSISETLGSILRLEDAARAILGEVCDVLGARRGSLWVYDADAELLRLTASVGEEGLRGPMKTDHPEAVTAKVFREGRSLILKRGESGKRTLHGLHLGDARDSFLSVPIRYSPPAGESRTVGVINLIGRRHGDRFTASDQKLLSAIASQVGAALENNRLIQESLAQERLAREMELAHNLQMKLLPAVSKIDGAEVAARVEPAESVGGDFYHLFKIPDGRLGVMIGDVSSHGFPAALIMALSMSAATIYASEFAAPAEVLRSLHDALRDELETTEMYLSLFYAVLDPRAGTLVYSNAGHPHAFMLPVDGPPVRLGATDPPVGIAGPDAYGQIEVEWAPDGLLFLFTDGLSDTLTSKATGSGEALILDTIQALRHATPDEIVEALFGLTIPATPQIPSDDRTAIVLRV